MSETPRTDAIFPRGADADPAIPNCAIELASLSRQLERELAALQAFVHKVRRVAETGTVENITKADCAKEFIAGLIVSDQHKADEIRRLSDELAKTNRKLDRYTRRSESGESPSESQSKGEMT